MGQHGLARAGLPRQDVEARRQAQLGPLDEQEVLDAQLAQHAPGCTSAARRTRATRGAAVAPRGSEAPQGLLDRRVAREHLEGLADRPRLGEHGREHRRDVVAAGSAPRRPSIVSTRTRSGALVVGQAARARTTVQSSSLWVSASSASAFASR